MATHQIRFWDIGNMCDFGFQGQLMDDELYGDKLAVIYEYRIHNPLIGRFFSVDPLDSDFPWNSPYAFSENRVISAVELEGLEAHDLNNGQTVNGPYSNETVDNFNTSNELSGGGLSFEEYIKEEYEKISHSTFMDVDGLEINEPFERKCENCDEVAKNMSTAHYSVIVSDISWEEEGVGEAGTGESFIPLWGSGRNAINDFQNSSYVSGTFNTALFVSDAFLVRSIVAGITKGGIQAMTLGNLRWGGSNSYRSYYLKSGFTKPNQPLHHWLIHKNQGIGKSIPNFIKNQMWNLKPFPTASAHMRYGHGKNWLGQPAPSKIAQLWFGIPTWPKVLVFSYGGRTGQITFSSMMNK